MNKNLRSIVPIVGFQYLAVILGCVWGFAGFHGVSVDLRFLAWLLEWKVAGSVAILAFAAEWLRYMASSRLRSTHPATLWLSLTLALGVEDLVVKP
jgi:hypothetical protein